MVGLPPGGYIEHRFSRFQSKLIVAVDYWLEVSQAPEGFYEHCELIVCDSAIVQEYLVDKRFKKSWCKVQSSYLRLRKIVVVKLQSPHMDFLKDRKGKFHLRLTLLKVVEIRIFNKRLPNDWLYRLLAFLKILEFTDKRVRNSCWWVIAEPYVVKEPVLEVPSRSFG